MDREQEIESMKLLDYRSWIYFSNTWKEMARQVMDEHPLCSKCEILGMVTIATEVDHVIPHKGDPELFYDMDNLKPLCKSCHSAKTGFEKSCINNKKRFPHLRPELFYTEQY